MTDSVATSSASTTEARVVTRVGVMGAGQLGRMLALAGIPLGLQFTFFSPEPSASAESVGDVMLGAWDDADALARFASSVDVVTYEFENVLLSAADQVERFCPLWPPRRALMVTQDRLREKEMFHSLGIPVAPYGAVNSLVDLRSAVERIGAPGILKSCRFGYDGKGQARINQTADIDTAWSELGGVPLIYEGLVRFERELSVIAVRGADGTKLVYPLVQNRHRDGILRYSEAPAPGLDDARRETAELYANRLLDALEYVGVFALELFDTPTGLIANEMAPRVHNSGHWTIEGAETSQFENHVRAICGLPLGVCAPVGHSAMINVIGTHPDIVRVLAVPNAHVHMYGKSERPGRKLGHFTIRSSTTQELRDNVAALGAVAPIL
ncbi:MAG: 5-(carboxyamino)imidazole ribonucleotide synthase [Gemmatimonadaceae bacterium]